MLSPQEIASAARGEALKRHIRAAAAMNGIYDDATLAERVGAHRRTVAGWWSGARPTPETLRQITDVTGLSLDELNRFVYYGGPPPHLPPIDDPTIEADAQERAATAERSHRVAQGAEGSEAPHAPHETTGSGR